MYGFLRSPIWIFGHLLTLALLVAFIIAGIWQLNRHHERQDKNTATLERAQEPVLGGSELAGLLAAGAGATAAAEQLEWRIADLNGTWAHSESVLIRNRSLSGLSGCHLAVPLELDGATDAAQDAAALVIAGWLASATCLEIANADDPTLELTQFATAALPATATTNLQGRIRLTQTRGLFGPTDPPTGRLDSLARVDVARINTQTPQTLLPAVYVELITATPSPPPTGDLQTLAPPSPGAGPHLGYTFQYFAFAAVALIGYPVVIIRHAKPKQNRQTNDL